MLKDTSKEPPIPSTLPEFRKKARKKKIAAALQAIKDVIEAIKAEVPKPRPKQPYVFMRKIYIELLKLQKSPHWNVFLKKVRKASPQKKTRARDCFRYLIDEAAQGAVDGQKSKYIKILTYARVNDMSSKEMTEFVNSHGTINKAVEHIRSRKKSKKSKVSKLAAKRKKKK